MIVVIRKLFLKQTNNSYIHFIRSIASGSISSILDFSTLILLVEIFNFHYLTGGIIGLIIGTTANYFISIIWIFNIRRIENKKLEYTIFILLGVLGGILNILFFWFLTDKINLYYVISRMIAATLVFIINFSARKTILFTKG